MAKAEKEKEEDQKEEFEVFVSDGFSQRLKQLGGSLVFTTYQRGKIFFTGLDSDDKIAIFERTFPRAMGVTFTKDHRSFCLGTLESIYEFDNLLEPGATYGEYDAYYAPHRSWITGNVDIHDVAYDDTQTPIFVATKFNCIARVARGFSFEAVWKPPFISKIVAEDRCHLNGMVCENNMPKFVTCVSDSDTADGWRERRADGGMVIDVASGERVLEGLSMPHSPRLHDGTLWILNSGTGALGWVDVSSGKFNPIAFCPGFARGLTIVDGYAIVGLSEPREGKTFDGLPLKEELAKRGAVARCGLIVVELSTGKIVDWMTVTGIVTELFDVDFLKGKRNGSFVGLRGEDIRKTISLKPSDRPSGLF